MPTAAAAPTTEARVRNGTYDHAKAPALWQYWVDAGAKRYQKEFGTPGAPIFPLVVRKEAAAFGRLFHSADQKEGMAAFLQKRQAKFIGK